MIVVIDVGCARYGGDYSIERLIEEFKPDMVYGFDPNEEIVASVPEGSERVNATRWLTPEGVGGALEKKAAWIYDGVVGFSGSGLGGHIELGGMKVPCFDLAHLIADKWKVAYERDHRDFVREETEIILKIDAEGAEYELLEHLIETGSDGLLKLAWVEWHPPGAAVNSRPDKRREAIEERITCEMHEWRW